MKPDEDDLQGEELEELRALWHREASDIRSLPSGSLDDADEATRAAVHWLQTAWAEEKKNRIPREWPDWVAQREARKSAPVASRFRTNRIAWMGGAVAAAAAAAAALLFLRGAPAEPIAETTTVIATHSEPTPSTPIAPAESAAARSASIFEAERFVGEPGRVELVTGNVRIVLVEAQHEVLTSPSR